MHIEYLDFCSPDYFQGFGGIVFAVSWYPEQTWRDVKDDLLVEINVIDAGQWDIAEFNTTYTTLVNDVFCDETLDETFPVMPELFDEGEPPQLYHYFGLVEDED